MSPCILVLRIDAFPCIITKAIVVQSSLYSSMSRATLGLSCIFFILLSFSGLVVFLFLSTGIKKWLPSNTKTTGTKWGLNSESIVANLATLTLCIKSSISGETIKDVLFVYIGKNICVLASWGRLIDKKVFSTIDYY